MTKPMRETMPTVAAWIDGLREVFGARGINDLIRAGINGQPTFWAREGGMEVGTKAPEPREFVTGDQMVIREPEKEESNADRNRRR